MYEQSRCQDQHSNSSVTERSVEKTAPMEMSCGGKQNLLSTCVMCTLDFSFETYS
jgi:hypothetical protein